MLLDAFAGGTIKVKTTDEVRELIDNMSLNEYRGQHEEEATPRKKGMIDLNTQDALLVSNKLLSIQLETTSKRLEAREDSQLSANTNWHLPASSWKWAKCMGNYSRQQRNPYSNTYNPGWAEYPNFFYWSNNVHQPPQTNPPPLRDSIATTKEKSRRNVLSRYEEYPRTY